MFLLSRGLYLRMLGAPLHYLYGATIIGVLLFVLLWWYVFYLPAVESTDQLQHAIDTMHQQTLMLKKSERELSTLEKSLSQLKISLQEYIHHKPRDNAQKTLALIADTALSNGIIVNSCRLCAERMASKDSIPEITFDGKGTLDQMIVFFETLKNSKRMIDCSKCQLSSIQNDLFSLQAVFTIFQVN